MRLLYLYLPLIFSTLSLVAMNSCSSKPERVERQATKKLNKRINGMITMLEKEDCDYMKFMDKYVDPMAMTMFKSEMRFEDVAEEFAEGDKKDELLKALKLIKGSAPTYLNDYKTRAKFTHEDLSRPVLFENVDGLWFIRN